MSQPADSDDHPLLPEDDESELRYDERTTDNDADEGDAEEDDG
jgi:hypothetical protein